MDFIATLAFIGAVVLLGFWYLQLHFSYWSRRGFHQLKPHFLYGNLKEMVKGKKHISEVTEEIYNTFKERGWKYGGYYLFFGQSFLFTDLQLVKNILQNDFQYFSGNQIFHHKKDFLSENLLALYGERWKSMRSSLTPTFSSAKMKYMFETMASTALRLKKKAKEIAVSGEPFEARDLMARFATDVIVPSAFGIECDSLEEPNNEFRRYTNGLFFISPWKVLKERMINWSILGYTGHKNLGNEELAQFLLDLVKQTSKARAKSNDSRKDFLHYLLKIKKKDFDPERKMDKKETQGNEGLSYEQMAAQSLLFYVGGYETTSATMSYALLNFALYPEFQEKCRQEVKQILKKYEGRMTYEAAFEMIYLEQFILESMRMYPPFGHLQRLCTKDYTIPGTNDVIKKGTDIVLPIKAIHMDPDIYSNPTVFNPDNFSKENRQNRLDVSFLAFGEGPRQCLGMRFGMLNAKTGLATILDSFEIKLNKKTQLPVALEPNSFVTTPKGQIWIDLLEIK